MMMPAVYCHLPAGSSVNQLNHFLNENIFNYFGENIKESNTFVEFDLLNVKAPIILFHSPADVFTQPEDVEQFIIELKGCVGLNVTKISKFGHMDFILSVNAPRLIYEKIREFFEKHKEG